MNVVWQLIVQILLLGRFYCKELVIAPIPLKVLFDLGLDLLVEREIEVESLKYAEEAYEFITWDLTRHCLSHQLKGIHELVN